MAKKRKGKSTFVWCVVTQAPGAFIVGESTQGINDFQGHVVLDNPVTMSVAGNQTTFEHLDMVAPLLVSMHLQVGAGLLRPDLVEHYRRYLALGAPPKST